MSAKTLLVMGGSNVSFESDGPSTSDLLAGELNRLQPGIWTVQTVDLAPGRGMADEAAALLEQEPVDVALLSLSAQASVYESVLIKVRRRWPRLLPAISAVEAMLRRDTANTRARSRPLIPWSYRVAQAVALGVIGGEPALEVEHHVENVGACLQRLAGREDTPILVRLPIGGAPAARARAHRYELRLRRLKAGIVVACERHHIPYVDIAELAARHSERVQHGFDNAHLGLETRRFEARQLASSVAAMAAEPSAPVLG